MQNTNVKVGFGRRSTVCNFQSHFENLKFPKRNRMKLKGAKDKQIGFEKKVHWYKFQVDFLFVIRGTAKLAIPFSRS